MKTEESILPLDFVLDHSEVITALSGYSPPIPIDQSRVRVGLQKAERPLIPVDVRWIDRRLLTYAHNESPLQAKVSICLARFLYFLRSNTRN